MIEILSLQILILFINGFIHLICIFLLDTRFREKAFKMIKIILFVSLTVTAIHVIFVPGFEAKVMSVFATSLWSMITYEPLVFHELFGSHHRHHSNWPVSQQFGKKILYPNLVIFAISFIFALKFGFISN